MAAQQSLILQSYPATAHAQVPAAAPDTVVVVTYADARTTLFTGRPRWRDRRGASRFDVVDVSDHTSRVTARLPAHGDVYMFGAEVTVSWRVVDAGEVVRRRTTDGDAVALGYLLDVFRSLSRRYQPRDVAGAEDALRSGLPVPVRLPAGLEIVGFSVALTVDRRLAERVTARDDALHTTDLDQLDVIRIQDRAERLRYLVDGPQGAVLVHLAQHPEDTGSVLQLMVQGRTDDRNHHLALLDRLLQNDFVQEADVAPLRAMLLGSAPGAWNPGEQRKLSSGPPPTSPINPSRPPTPRGATGADDDDLQPSPAAPEDEDVRPAPAPAEPPPADGVVGWRPVGRQS